MYVECIYYIYYLLFWLVFASVVRKYKSYSRARAEPRSNQKTGERGGGQGLMHCLHSTRTREFWNSVRQRTGQSTFLTGRQGVSGYKGIPLVVFLLATSYLIRVIFVPRTTLSNSIFKTFQDQGHVNEKKDTHCFDVILFFHIDTDHTYLHDLYIVNVLPSKDAKKKFKVKCASHGGMYGPHYFGKISSKQWMLLRWF